MELFLDHFHYSKSQVIIKKMTVVHLIRNFNSNKEKKKFLDALIITVLGENLLNCQKHCPKIDLMLNIITFINLDFTVKYDLTWFSRDSLKVFSSQSGVCGMVLMPLHLAVRQLVCFKCQMVI